METEHKKYTLLIEFATIVLLRQWQVGGDPTLDQFKKLYKFIAKITEKTQISYFTLILCLALSSKLSTLLKQHDERDNHGVVYRIFITSLIIANKVLDDNPFRNAEWSFISQIPLRELNKMETELLQLLSYRVWFKANLMEDFLKDLNLLAMKYCKPSSLLTVQSLIHSFEERQCRFTDQYDDIKVATFSAKQLQIVSSSDTLPVAQ